MKNEAINRTEQNMRQAITTKYFGPTNVRGSRVKATCEAGSITLSWDHALNSQANHTAAARALAAKLGWTGAWVGGGMAPGYCFVLITVPDLTLAMSRRGPVADDLDGGSFRIEAP